MARLRDRLRLVALLPAVVIAVGVLAFFTLRSMLQIDKLRQQSVLEATLALALQALAADFEPLTDLRASASYRRRAAAGLLRRFHLETRADAPLSPVQTRVFSAFDSLTPQPGAASTHASNARDANTGAGDSGAVDLYPPDA